MQKIQQAMQDDAIRADRDHPAFIPVPGRRKLKVMFTSLAKFPARLPRSRLVKPRSREPSQSTLSYKNIENFTKELETSETGPTRSTINGAHCEDRPGMAKMVYKIVKYLQSLRADAMVLLQSLSFLKDEQTVSL